MSAADFGAKQVPARHRIQGGPIGFDTFSGIQGQAVDKEESGGGRVAPKSSAGRGVSLREGVTRFIQYPMNVSEDQAGMGAPDGDAHGHYINFYIHSMSAGRATHKNKALSKLIGKTAVGSSGNETFRNQGDRSGATTARKTFAAISPPRKQLKTAISLYMPATVTTAYGATYQDKEIGIGTEAILDGIRAASAGGVDDEGYAATFLDKAVSGTAAAVKTTLGGLPNVLTKALANVPAMSGVNAMLGLGTGTVSTNRMELLFERINRRTFSYTFTFIPQSVEEAKDIQEIVFLFKYGMHPQMTTGYGTVSVSNAAGEGIGDAVTTLARAGDTVGTGGVKSGRFFIMPDIFDIEYMSYGKKNTFVHEISSCYLENISVNYGGDKFRAHDITEGMFGTGAPAQTTVLTLNFKEILHLSKSDIEAGY